MQPPEYTQKQLTDIENLAALFFTPKEIEIILSVEPSETFEFSYQRGQLKQMAKLRKSIFEQAANNSTPAQTLALKIIDACKINQL